MHRFFAVSLSCASLLATLAVLPDVAAASQPRHRAHMRVAQHRAPPLTVRKRSFLDPGNVVPVGSTQRYMMDNTIFNRTPDQLYARSKFGNETLPGPFDLMGAGRPQSIFEFSTGGY